MTRSRTEPEFHSGGLTFNTDVASHPQSTLLSPIDGHSSRGPLTRDTPVTPYQRRRDRHLERADKARKPAVLSTCQRDGLLGIKRVLPAGNNTLRLHAQTATTKTCYVFTPPLIPLHRAASPRYPLSGPERGPIPTFRSRDEEVRFAQTQLGEQSLEHWRNGKEERFMAACSVSLTCWFVAVVDKMAASD